MLVDTRFNDLTQKAIGCAMSVHRELGSGFPEQIYQRGLAVELAAAGIAFQGEIHLPVFYKSTNSWSTPGGFLVGKPGLD